MGGRQAGELQSKVGGWVGRYDDDEGLDGMYVARYVGRGTHTISTTAFPLSLTIMGKGASRPVDGSRRTRKAWCGRLALPSSLAVRRTFNGSELLKGMVSVAGPVWVNLRGRSKRRKMSVMES